MEFKLLYWYWLVFGMVLIIAELLIPSFTIFWFGLGAILVAGVLLMLPDLAISWQLFICDQKIAIGDRVIVKDISGNTLIVMKQSS